MNAKIESTIKSLEFLIENTECIYTRQILELDVINLKSVLRILESEVVNA
ncbi:hypothetical protein [Pedobacter sp.]